MHIISAVLPWRY